MEIAEGGEQIGFIAGSHRGVKRVLRAHGAAGNRAPILCASSSRAKHGLERVKRSIMSASSTLTGGFVRWVRLPAFIEFSRRARHQPWG